MSVTIKEVKTRAELRQYIYLPAQIHHDHSNWIPPIYMDEWAYYNPKKNETLENCDTILLLAYSEGKPVGRIMGIINHVHNKRQNEKNARFNYLEVWNDQEVAHALISYVEDWAIKKGMDKIIGPFGFSDKDPQGYLIEGHDELHIMATHCNYKYLTEILEKEGYSKELDLVSYCGKVPDPIPPLFERICERTLKNNPDLKLIEFTKSKDVKPYVVPVLRLLNETYTNIYGFEELTDREINEFAGKYLLFIDPAYIKIVVNESNNPVAFFVAMANFNSAVKKSKGRLFPFGIFQIWRTSKKSTHATMMLGAIKEEYRSRGLDTLMSIKIIKAAKERGIKTFDSHCQMESNTLMRSAVEKVGAEVFKKFRIFQKSLINR